MIFNTSFSFGPSTLNPKREAGIIYLSRTDCSAYGLEEWLMRYKSEETMDRIVKSVERFFFAHHRSPVLQIKTTSELVVCTGPGRAKYGLSP